MENKHEDNRCINLYSKQSECVSHLQKKKWTSHAQNRENTEQSTHGRQPPLGSSQKKTNTHTQKKPGLHLKIETRAVMFVVLHGTCSVVPNTDCSQHLHMGTIQSEKGLVADLLCRQLFSQPLIYFLPCWWILRLTHFIWRHNLKIKCLSGTVQVEREQEREIEFEVHGHCTIGVGEKKVTGKLRTLTNRNDMLCGFQNRSFTGWGLVSREEIPEWQMAVC